MEHPRFLPRTVGLEAIFARTFRSIRARPRPSRQDSTMLSIDEQDLGTPPRDSAKMVRLTIDGREARVPAGTSVMRAAALCGSKIPKLCATEQLEAFGSCRLCLVQIEGMKGLPASCTTLVSAGMKVTTQSKTLAKVRRG